MKRYLMVFDQGTTSSRTIIFDSNGKIVAKAGREFTQYFPKAGWVEHDAMEIFNTQIATAKEALTQADISAADIAAIGITNQRETTIVWDKTTGSPIYPAIVWQCRRTERTCAELKNNGVETLIKQKTGLAADPYFSATKLSWILHHVPGVKERAARGELLFGTVDSWLIFCLTGGKAHVTDVSNASRTMLFNIHTLAWDNELLSLFQIPISMLPKVLPSGAFFGETAPHFFNVSIPIMGVAGDQQAALFGQGCFTCGTVKNTYGTGGFLLMNTGETPVASQNGLLTTVGWQLGNETTYVLEGSVFVCGAAIQWLRDSLSLVTSATETEAIARTVPDSGGVLFVPSFVGLGTPYWNSEARGTICGITRGTTKAHIVRATLEAMAYQTEDVLAAMRHDTGYTISILRVDGGAAANNLLLELQSNFSGLPIMRPASVESTAYGIMGITGIATGIFADKHAFADTIQTDCIFSPSITEQERQHHLERWHKAVNAAITFAT